MASFNVTGWQIRNLMIKTRNKLTCRLSQSYESFLEDDETIEKSLPAYRTESTRDVHQGCVCPLRGQFSYLDTVLNQKDFGIFYQFDENVLFVIVAIQQQVM